MPCGVGPETSFGVSWPASSGTCVLRFTDLISSAENLLPGEPNASRRTIPPTWGPSRYGHLVGARQTPEAIERATAHARRRMRSGLAMRDSGWRPLSPLPIPARNLFAAKPTASYAFPLGFGSAIGPTSDESLGLVRIHLDSGSWQRAVHRFDTGASHNRDGVGAL